MLNRQLIVTAKDGRTFVSAEFLDECEQEEFLDSFDGFSSCTWIAINTPGDSLAVINPAHVVAFELVPGPNADQLTEPHRDALGA